MKNRIKYISPGVFYFLADFFKSVFRKKGNRQFGKKPICLGYKIETGPFIAPALQLTYICSHCKETIEIVMMDNWLKCPLCNKENVLNK